MDCLQVLKSSPSLFSISQSNSLLKPYCFCSEFKSNIIRKRILKLQNHRNSKFVIIRRFRVCCKLQEDDNQTGGEEPPESLFMKELKRRGLSPTSLLEESNRSIYAEEEMKFQEEDGGFSRRNTVSTDVEKSLSNQRERSMALNSEGLEGLIPWAKILLTIGATFFLGFWPFVLITIVFFSAVYLYFGPSFIYDASKTSIAPPQYIDPYALLEDETISQTAPPLN